MIRRHVNLRIIIIRRLKNNLRIRKYINNFSTFTEKLIIIYTIIHELSGTKRCEYIIENMLLPNILLGDMNIWRLTISHPKFGSLRLPVHCAVVPGKESDIDYLTKQINQIRQINSINSSVPDN